MQNCPEWVCVDAHARRLVHLTFTAVQCWCVCETFISSSFNHQVADTDTREKPLLLTLSSAYRWRGEQVIYSFPCVILVGPAKPEVYLCILLDAITASASQLVALGLLQLKAVYPT